MTFLRKFDLTTALAEILYNGMRAWAKGLTFMVKDTAYGVYFVKYTPTLQENKEGRWN